MAWFKLYKNKIKIQLAEGLGEKEEKDDTGKAEEVQMCLFSAEYSPLQLTMKKKILRK